MATPPPTSLTRKFSRSSLKQATGLSSIKVHSIDEEIARARNKRFNSDSWKRVSKAYRVLPTAALASSISDINDSTIQSNQSEISNTQILTAMSSLTEDPAFRKMNQNKQNKKNTGHGDPRMIASSRSFSNPNSHSRLAPPARIIEEPTATISKTVSPSASFVTAEETPLSELAAPTPVAAPKATQVNTSLRSANSNNPPRSIPLSSASFSSGSSAHEGARPSLRNTANRTPAVGRNMGKRFPNSPLTRGGNMKSGQIDTSQSRFQPPKRSSSIRSPQSQPSTAHSQSQSQSRSQKNNKVSFFSLIISFFKLLQQILLFPYHLATGQSIMMLRRWTPRGRTVLITGASSGIGAEMARQYAAQGAKIALISRTAKDLERVANECKELGSGKAQFYAADLSNSTSTKMAMQQAISDFGKFDVVVLNAGRSQGCYFEEIKDPAQIESMIKLNVNGAITSLHYLLPHIPKSRDSRIVVVSNTAGIVAAPYQSIYSATKYALTGFSNSIRIELKNTYGNESPKVCLVSFPEVAGTKSNTRRMDMGAKLPPAKWYSWAGIPLPHAVHDLLPAIAAGKREFGQPFKFNLWRSLYTICPEWVDFWVMQYIQRTHYRPIDESHIHRGKKKGSLLSSSAAAMSSSSKNNVVKAPPNKSWAH